MSPRSRKPLVPVGVRDCQYCGKHVGEDSPLYLMAAKDGRIVGPFHPECAVTVVARQQAAKDGALPPGMDFGRVVPNVVQEELL